VEGIGNRGRDDLAVLPSASLRSGDGKRGGHDPATGVAHVRTQGHGVGIDLLVESPAEIPVSNEALRTHQMAKALPVLLVGPLPDVSD
jgi:hypothetical protein